MDLQSLNDEQWLKALSFELIVPGIPKLPPEQIQLNFTGSTGKRTLTPAFDFYKLVKNEILKSLKSINGKTKILDFGCGWGRITRFWLKDFVNQNIFGVDPLPEIVQLCKDTIQANFLQIDPAPPIEFENNFFDVITAYSVFSHLNEEYTNKWLKEFHRILKPGGILAITTRSRSFIEHCASLNQASLQQQTQGLANCFKDPDKYLKQYDSGKFVHQATGGGGLLKPDFFGESCIPKKYFNQFIIHFELRKFIDNMINESNQSCAILRKKI